MLPSCYCKSTQISKKKKNKRKGYLEFKKLLRETIIYIPIPMKS